MQGPEGPDAGAQAKQIGAQLTEAGQAVSRLALEAQAEANQFRVDEALNQAKERALDLTHDDKFGYTKLKGKDAVYRPDGKPLSMEYGEMFQKEIDGIAQGLGNDAQRAKFMQAARGMSASLYGGLTQHEAQESKAYKASVADGLIKTASREVALSAATGDFASVDKAYERMHEAVAVSNRLTGKSAIESRADIQAVFGKSLGVAVDKFIGDGNFDAAEKVMAKYGESIDVADGIKWVGMIQHGRSVQAGMQAADEVLGSVASSYAPTDFDRLWGALTQQESGGRQVDKNGRVITSIKGALGASQLMPDTAKYMAKKLGIPFDLERVKTDRQYNEMLGKAYLQEQLKDFNYDVSKALAAYNAGPGKVREWEAAAEKWNKANPTQPRTWQQAMNYKETIGYVANITKSFAAGGGVAPPPTELELQRRAEQARPDIAQNPVAQKALAERLSSQHKLREADAKQKEDNAVVGAIQFARANGLNFTELPPQYVGALSPASQKEVQTTLAALAKGNNLTNKTAAIQYLGNPSELKKLTERQMYGLMDQFDEGDQGKLLDQWSKATGRTPTTEKDQSGNINDATFNYALDSVLKQNIPLQVGNLKKGSKEAAYYDDIKYVVRTEVIARQLAAGQQFNDAEMMAEVTKIFSQKRQGVKSEKQTTIFGVGTQNYGTSQLTPYRIDSKQQSAIVAALRKSGIANPTDQQVTTYGWQHNLAQQRGKK